ncbi:MAG: c-type cytochrome [Limnohabitans sp.]|jgi:mono/diheme cytochrome c family protein|uniref:c-type cytochrome n=1 Tax=Limnohabitans sp. TaxID=1907725 RepID=UPI0026008734|nr:c-type cytochrome [Limnohabitans sp.]MCO4089815.1 c-type cytochrome [Limnohabitans sp.]
MNNNSIQRAVIASILSVTASAWAQTSVGLGRADYRDNCASCHGTTGKGNGPMGSFLVKPASDLTQIAQRNGGKFPQELMWEIIDGRWSGDGGPHGSREMPVWGQEFKARAMTQTGDSPTTAEWSARNRIVSLIRYLETIQVP